MVWMLFEICDFFAHPEYSPWYLNFTRDFVCFWREPLSVCTGSGSTGLDVLLFSGSTDTTLCFPPVPRTMCKAVSRTTPRVQGDRVRTRVERRHVATWPSGWAVIGVPADCPGDLTTLSAPSQCAGPSSSGHALLACTRALPALPPAAS